MKEILQLKKESMYYEEVGDYDKAEVLLSRAVAMKERSLGPEHPALADDLHRLGMLNLSLRDHGKAEELLVRALAIKRSHLSADHPDVVDTLSAIKLVQIEHDFAESA